MSDTLSIAGPDIAVSPEEQEDLLATALARRGRLRKVLVLPPDFTRFHSGAGAITQQIYRQLEGRASVDVLPAIGTHSPMPESQLRTMFGSIPLSAFRVHDWRGGIVRLGEVPGEFVREVSGGRVDYPIHAEVDRLLVEGGYDLIISVGQVVPHEVIGMANQNKNVFVGTGGPDTINKTHFLGAVCDMEKIMGHERSPVRDVLNYAESRFASHLPILYALTVRGRQTSGELVTRGLYVGGGDEGFLAACRLSQQVNLDLLDEPLQRVVVYLDPEEFKSTWLGNKSVYRTRMAIADGGELIVLAPGLHQFGEDAEIDRLIRKYGYRTTPEILHAVNENDDLRANRSAAAHLIHGSSEGRFRITYAPGHVSREEIEGVGYRFADYAELAKRYDPENRRDGFHVTDDGESFYFISNPALGLWAHREKFTANG